MSLSQPRSFRTLLVATFTASLLSSGCASLDLSGLGFAGKAPPRPQLAPNTPMFHVESRPAGGKPNRATVPLTKPTLASEVFAQMNGHPFARSNAYIIRKTPDGKSQVKLALDWEGGRTGVVSTTTNYAIHPGDRIVISENPNTYFDDMINNVTKPLAFMSRHGGGGR